jgi:FimV-like protein
VALWRANPNAFDDNDFNRLKASAGQLALPNAATALAIDAKEAQKICAEQIDSVEQKRHNTSSLRELRKSQEDQRPLRPGDTELVYFGDNLGSIVKRYEVPDAQLNQKLVAVFQANPHAFSRNNMNLLRTAVSLSMPDAQRVLDINNDEAKQIVQAHEKDFLAYKNPVTV